LSLPERIASFPVVLCTLRLSDAPRILELCGDREVAQTTALIPHPYLPGMAESWIAASNDAHASGVGCTYAITRVDDGLLVGAIGISPDADAVPSLGYWLGRPYWGNGYATAAARAVVALAFAHMDVDVLGAIHLARNPASGRVLARCAMTEGPRAMRPHRGGPPEEFRTWSISRVAWEAATLGSP
jgi:ribosomal-protein-alanine N-acetyltransferase